MLKRLRTHLVLLYHSANVGPSRCPPRLEIYIYIISSKRGGQIPRGGQTPPKSPYFVKVMHYTTTPSPLSAFPHNLPLSHRPFPLLPPTRSPHFTQTPLNFTPFLPKPFIFPPILLPGLYFIADTGRKISPIIFLFSSHKSHDPSLSSVHTTHVTPLFYPNLSYLPPIHTLTALQLLPPNYRIFYPN